MTDAVGAGAYEDVPFHGYRGWRGYAVAVGCSVLIVLLRYALQPLLPTGYPFITLFVGVYVATWYGGLGPGLLALVLGTLGVWFFLLPPAIGFAAADRRTAIALAVNILNNLLLIALGTAQHVSRRRAERSAKLAAERVVAVETEAARREAAEATLRDVLESTTDAYVGFDRDWRIVYLNPQAELAFETYGFDPAALPGRTIWEVWPDAAGTALERELRRVMTERVRGTFEYLHPVSGRWYELHAYPMAEGAAVFFRDVTERVVTQRQLEQSQRMDAVGQLAGGVAHEVNNQMTVVLGASSFLLRRPDLPDWVRDELEYIREAAQRSAAVTGQLLAFGRRQMLRPEPLDLNAVLEDLDAILRRAVGPAIEVQLALSPERLSVVADRGKVEQALLNLTFNARDAMPKGGALRLETGRAELLPGNHLDNGAEAHPGSYAVLRVKDTGIGMDHATLSRVFEPFFTTKPTGQGTGLGLSTVYGIVRQSGGYVVAESAPGSGAAFTIYLPRAAAPSVPAPVVTSEHGLLMTAPGSRGVALVVEDEESVRRMVGRVLTEEGYDVVEATDGAGALEAIERLRIDGTLRLVVTDLAMPVMGGRELARRITEARPHVPVLFMSGYTDDEVGRRGLLGEGQDFLPKPFSPGSLARHVRQLAGTDTFPAPAAPVPSPSLRSESRAD